MHTFWQDLRYGWRILQRNRGFALVAALTLAIGIGANAAIFSAVDALLLHPLPYGHPDRIVVVWTTFPELNVQRGTASPAEFLDWRDMNRVFSQMAAWRSSFVTTTGNGEPEQLWEAMSSANFFRLLGVKPMLGRDFLPGEDQLGHEKVAILSYRLWQRRFQGDRKVLGKSIVLDYQPYEIVGVLPPSFSLFGTPVDLDVWVPLAFTRAQLDRKNYGLIVFARLKQGVEIDRARADMATIDASLKKRYPEMDQRTGLLIETLPTTLTHSVRPALVIFIWAVGFVLLIACANVANLMLARAASREREIVLRTALGARPGRVLRQLLTESILLAGLGGGFGLIVAFGGIRFMRVELVSELGIPFAGTIHLSGSVVLFTLGLSLLTGIVFGLAPAIQILRSSLSGSLKEGGLASTSGRGNHLLRSSLMVCEVALSLSLVVVAGLLTRSFVRLLSQNLGFNPENLLTMRMQLPVGHYSATEASNFYEQTLDRVRVIPGVKAASAVDFLMFTRWSDNFNFDIAGRTPPSAGDQFTSPYQVIDWRYLQTVGIPILSGRDFGPGDGPNAAGVVLINRALARRYWPNEDPVGKQIRIHIVSSLTPVQAQKRDSWLTIVGVTGDVRDWEWGDEAMPTVYLPMAQDPSWLMSLVIRENASGPDIVPAVRHIVSSLDANQPVTAVRMMDAMVNESLAPQWLDMVLLGIFASVALVLAAVGIYGVMAYAVSQRTHEIGIRMALGAEPRDVLRMIVREGMALTGLGMLIGLVAAVVAALYLHGHLYGVQIYGIRAVDPVTFIGVPVLIACVAIVASYVPARRATKVDPLVALRYE
jgi:putative ABC transport system permease protein